MSNEEYFFIGVAVGALIVLFTYWLTRNLEL